MKNMLDQYVTVLSSLEAHKLYTLDAVTSNDILFQDPFNKTTNRTALKAIFSEMYEKLNDVTFLVSKSILSNDTGFIIWTFSGDSKLTGSFSFEGSSEVIFDSKGLVISHRDYWDASLLMETLPVFGLLIKSLRKRMQTS